MTDHPVSPAAHPLPLMNPNNSTTEATGHSDEQQYMISLTNGAYCCDWLVDGVSRCGYKSIKGNVKRHIRVVHLSIRPFRCGVCSRTFSNKSALENHQSVHSDNKPYQCYQCGRGFGCVANLSRHRVRVHGHAPPHRQARP